MATGSTPSSGTDGSDPQDPADHTSEAAIPSEGAEPTHDPSRRAFFGQFSKRAVSAAGQVAGMADAVARTSTVGITELLGLDEEAPSAGGPTFARSEAGPVSAAPPGADDAFRSPYRFDGDELVLLDQRGIPEQLDEVVARRGADVAYYLRLGVVRGGPAMAQVAAHGLALTGAELAEASGERRTNELRRTERALIEARRSSRLIAWAAARMRSAIAGFSEASPGTEVAAALRAEADDIAESLAAAQAAIAESLAGILAPPEHGSLTVLVHGDQGALNGGLVGTGLPALRRLRDEGHQVRIFVTEGRPFMDGARLASWELRGAGLEHRIIPDAAVAWLLDREPVEAVLLSAEWVAANGDVGGLVGSRGIAQLAADSAIRVIASGPSGVIDEAVPDGGAIPVELRPAGDLVAYLAHTPVRTNAALVPASDVVPAALVSTFVTEKGVVEPGAIH